MVAGCGAKLCKYGLFTFNLIFFIAGGIAVGFGVWLIVDQHALHKVADAVDELRLSKNETELVELSEKTRVLRDAGILLTAGGGIIFFVAFLGCCGAIREWRPLLVLYGVFLVIILGLEIAAAIYAAVNRDQLETNTRKLMVKSLRFYNHNTNASSINGITEVWASAMKEYECCGVNGNLTDFQDSIWWKYMNKTGEPDQYPPYCCRSPSGTTPNVTIGSVTYVLEFCGDKDPLFTEGCYTKLKRTFIENQMSAVVGVGIAVGVIQLIGIIFAFSLSKAITAEDAA